jgi:hypothetical protein
MVKIGDTVVYQTQNGDLLPPGVKAGPGEIYQSTAAIVTSMADDEKVGCVVFLDSSVTPIAFGVHGFAFHVGGVDHGSEPNGWRTQDEVAKDRAGK